MVYMARKVHLSSLCRFSFFWRPKKSLVHGLRKCGENTYKALLKSALQARLKLAYSKGNLSRPNLKYLEPAHQSTLYAFQSNFCNSLKTVPFFSLWNNGRIGGSKLYLYIQCTALPNYQVLLDLVMKTVGNCCQMEFLGVSVTNGRVNPIVLNFLNLFRWRAHRCRSYDLQRLLHYIFLGYYVWLGIGLADWVKVVIYVQVV